MAGDNERSEWATRNAIKLNPTRAVNYSNLAWTLCAMGSAEEAEQNYLRALSLGYKDNGTLRDTIINAKAVTAKPSAEDEDAYEDEE